MYLLGYDIGSSSVKASILDASTGVCKASAFYPKEEMTINAIQKGWAEQNPEMWWQNLKLATQDVLSMSSIYPRDIKAIGISYQMHGLVLVDKYLKILRPSIIWCDSRAVAIGEKALIDVGREQCLDHFLNSPGNFTASKLKWVKDNEPELFDRIYKMMLPGDYIAMRLSGEVCTTVSGLSEGILWDYKEKKVAESLLDYYGISIDLIPNVVDAFTLQGQLTSSAANELGLLPGTVIAYRAGDQPNNALSLKVLNPGEVAATAGTSGVVYGVSDIVQYDPLSRVNTFAHVNHSESNIRLGILLCINGTGILNSWIKKNLLQTGISYDQMNLMASNVPIGSDGVSIIPFGNGAERMLCNKEIGCEFVGVNFNNHSSAHLVRAAHEAVAFSFKYGMDIMEGIGIAPKVIRAGASNMFLSPVFRETLSNITGATIELYNTDGSQGAAIGAGIGVGVFKSFDEAFKGLKQVLVTNPTGTKVRQAQDAYNRWLQIINKRLDSQTK